MDLTKLWALVRADLARARGTLPRDCASDKAIHDYQDFLEHHELELACDMLEVYAEDHEVSRDFWLALRDATAKMQLPKVNRYETNARNSPAS
jgi:hypothetical protein